MTAKYPEIASQWAIGRLVGVSASSVGKIWQEATGKVQTVATVAPESFGSCEWLRVHACWALDTAFIRLSGTLLYLMILVEEYSRLLLGWKLCADKTPQNAWGLVANTISSVGRAPLILKHDNGGEFAGDAFQLPLKNAGVEALPSPAYYAPFNGRCERSIKEVRKFTRPVEEKFGSNVYDLTGAIRRGFRIINDVLPRRMFRGRTSREAYQEGRKYTLEECHRLTKLMRETQKRLEVEHERRKKYYEHRRRIIIGTVRTLNLCEVKYG
jgi:transposase InsO family protein